MSATDTKRQRKALVYGRSRPKNIGVAAYGLFQLQKSPIREEFDCSFSVDSSSSSSGDFYCGRREGGPLCGKTNRNIVGANNEAQSPTAETAIPQEVRPTNARNHGPGTPVQKGRGGVADKICASTYDVPSSEGETNSGSIYHGSSKKRRKLTPNKSEINVMHTIKRTQSRTADPARRSDEQRYKNEMADSKTSQGTLAMKSPTNRTNAARTASKLPTAFGSSHKSSSTTPEPSSPVRKELAPTLSFDTPSKIPLTGLQLAPRRSFTVGCDDSDHSILGHKIPDEAPPPSPPRRRLVDAMASPRKGSFPRVSATGERNDDLHNKKDPQSKAETVRNESRQPPITGSRSHIGSKETSSFSSDNVLSGLKAPCKSKLTYSRERSHLSAMVSQEAFAPLSQDASTQDPFSQSQDSALLAELDIGLPHTGMDEQNDEDQDTTGIRSIHELRQAGSNARSRVDMDALLDDIEASGPSSRAKKLHGLVHLAAKLDRPDMTSQVLESSIDQRLLRCTVGDKDTLSQTVFTIALSRLLLIVQLPSFLLSRAFTRLLSISTNVLPDSTQLESMVRKSDAGLAGSTRRATVDLVKSHRLSSIWSDCTPNHLSPQLVLIKSLDIILRQARQLGDFRTVLPTSVFERLTELLVQSQKQLSAVTEAGSHTLLIVVSTVSVLESCTISREWAREKCLSPAKRLSELGPLMNLLHRSKSPHCRRTQTLILRLFLNITNNSPDLCDTFARASITQAIFGIVYVEFAQVTGLGDVALDATHLDDVILALGALTNLAEHSELFRQAMQETSFEGQRMVDWLAGLFGSQVDQVHEVTCGYFHYESRLRSMIADILPGFFGRTIQRARSLWLSIGFTLQPLPFRTSPSSCTWIPAQPYVGATALLHSRIPSAFPNC